MPVVISTMATFFPTMAPAIWYGRTQGGIGDDSFDGDPGPLDEKANESGDDCVCNYLERNVR
jgi:hypothetical protein